ncbi:cuticle protein 6-like [Panulirus ornatus]|uniref:cuticle protein 6-like n=1 Tax=Panulirus ornatus TaxID=150431 RepID=UPI003A869F7B
MNSLTVLFVVAVTVCSGAQLPWYQGLYGAYPGLHSWYRSGLPLMTQPATETMAPVPMAYNMAPFASMAPIHSQYNARDEFGQYSFGYNGGFNNRAEVRDAFGNVQGSYNYVDSDGKVQTQHYVADAMGFRVSGTNLPEATAPEFLDYAADVAAARAEHMAAHEAAAAPAPMPEPKYIDYTPEVAAARAEHQTAHEEAAAAAAV